MQRRSIIWGVICLFLGAMVVVLGAVAAQPTYHPSERAPIGAQRPDRLPDERAPQEAFPDQPQLNAVQQVIVQPRAGSESVLDDAHIIEETPTTREGSIGALTVRPSPTGMRRYSLLKWQLQGIVPDGATIVSARLELFCYDRLRELDLIVAAYPVLVPWDEASVTWNQASDGVPWSTPGGSAGIDRGSLAICTSTILGIDSVPGWHDWDIAALVQEWVNHPADNHGLIMISSGGSVRYDFQSGESGAQDLRPKLLIEYSDLPTTPSPTPEPSQTATPTGTQIPTATSTRTPTPESWIDVSRAMPAFCLQSFDGDTTGKPNDASYYGDVPWPETGPEDVYVLVKYATSDLTVSIEVWEPGDDLDIFLLSSPDPASLMGGDRVGWGDQWFTYPNLGAGTYYIVVDGVDGSQGAYRLHVTCQGEPTPTPTLTNTPVFGFYPLLLSMSTPTPRATATFTPSPTFTPAPTVLPYARAVNCGGSQPYTSADGRYYESDQMYVAGWPEAWGFVDANADTGTYTNVRDIAGTADEVVYQTHRYAMDKYLFTVPNGRYEVQLHFAELFPFAHLGDRVFAVDIEGQRVMDGFDMIARGFKYTAYTETAYVDVVDGQLDISFVPQASYGAAINGIRITRVGEPTGF